VNVLLVGLGRWGEKHLRVLGEVGATVWVADVSAGRRRWAVEQGIPERRIVADYREALPHIDAVDLVTPADSHLAVAAAVLEADRHCFIEKPLATSVDACRQIVAAADRAGRVVQVGHIFRFHPVTATLRAALRDERLGNVRYATGRFAGFKRPRTDVGVTHTDAIHYFDLFAYLFQREPTAVSALQRDFLGRGLDDMSMTTLIFGDLPTVIEANYFVPGTYRECHIVTEAGTLVADYGASTVRLYTGVHERRGEGWEVVDTGKIDFPVGREEPLRAELTAFLRACEQGLPAAVDARAGLRAVEIVEAAALAARLGRVVALDELRAALAAGTDDRLSHRRARLGDRWSAPSRRQCRRGACDGNRLAVRHVCGECRRLVCDGPDRGALRIQRYRLAAVAAFSDYRRPRRLHDVLRLLARRRAALRPRPARRDGRLPRGVRGALHRRPVPRPGDRSPVTVRKVFVRPVRRPGAL